MWVLDNIKRSNLEKEREEEDSHEKK